MMMALAVGLFAGGECLLELWPSGRAGIVIGSLSFALAPRWGYVWRTRWLHRATGRRVRWVPTSPAGGCRAVVVPDRVLLTPVRW